MIDFVVNNWGDLASVLGLGITVWIVWASKRASERAAEAAESVRNQMLNFDVVQNLGRTLSMMEEIKRLHRAQAWNILPDRYATVRKLLIGIRDSNSVLNEDEQGIFTAAVQHFFDIEKKVESANATSRNHPSVVTLNKLVSEQIDKLTEMQSVILTRVTEN